VSTFTVTRQIAIDAGHRIMTHGSKCRHLHGHRYTVEATCEAREKLHESGEQTDMVLDFGFLKEEMLGLIDAPCDHGLILSAEDAEVLGMFAPDAGAADWAETIRAGVAAEGFAAVEAARLGQKLYVVPFQPTAECLARHWFERLRPAVVARSGGVARLVEVTVWETPNCRASYRP
jgi:6-pyruvoyltetrahydropterin/6-carboxytetrahydropterin synthase